GRPPLPAHAPPAQLRRSRLARPQDEAWLLQVRMSAEVMGEVQEIRALARQFAEERVRPHVERWDRDGAFDDDVIAQLAELGFLGLVVPEAAGGIGLGRGAFVAAVEE